MTGAARLLEVLSAHGVEVVFGLPGVHNLAVWEALEASGIRMIGVRHEQTAVYAADGYARTTGKLGVAIVTTGPGAANALGATGEAMSCGSPVLVIATDIPSTLRRPGVYRGVLHETRDQRAMFLPVTKTAFDVPSAAELPSVIDQAARQALTAPHGPVYVGVPTDYLSAAVDNAVGGLFPTDFAANRPLTAVPDLGEALRLIEEAEKPLIWAGGGAARADAGTAVGALATALSAPVITTYGSRGLVEHPLVVRGPVHAPPVGELWDDADLVIAIGTDFDGMMTQNWLQPAPKRLIAINIDKADAAKNYHPDVTLVGDAREVTAALANAVPNRPFEDRVSEVNAAVRALVAADSPEAKEFLDAVADLDVTFVADMCIPGYWMGGFHHVTRPRGLAYPVGWGTLGFGFPASLGAALAGRTVAVCGDGGFLFACGDLATLAQEQLPVTVVLVDDGGYGMLRYDQQVAGHTVSGVDLHRPDFAMLSASFGIPAVTVDGFGPSFKDTLDVLTTAEGPNMLIVNASLKPPVNTSPRWYRRRS
ncbi:acetolactate synthase I/II/III large subunit [Lentzea sp. NBRC 105346]|uniref:thiamine pyrophosphate-binding protein n=1 Tax=Lentzea sp. NBRC 105346 TaxID=3032205 RepID=UPI0024A47532|nr:thiamine pyrophosphate-binding protein [Lentzea sp. NBRC 105346]GLZ29534.1 acetolactate synthase I/II/III large subunit [Lentzea sp. NBRC 105346]